MKKINLFLLPFAGGSRYSFSAFAKYCPEEINLIPLEIPGRGNRIKEDLLGSLALITKDLFEDIKDKLNTPYAIYGHSMGATTGYLLTKKIIEEKLPEPSFLFFTGRPAPSIKDKTGIRYSLPKDQFWGQLKEYGGCPDEILANQDLMDFFEPILRSDFKALETHKYHATEKIKIPIKVIIGSEEKTTLEEALPWKDESEAKVDIKVLPGNHFFIFDHAAVIMDEVRLMHEEAKEKIQSMTK